MPKGMLIVLAGLLLYFIGIIIMFLIKRKNIKSIEWVREAIKLLLVTYIFMVISVTMFPIVLGRTEEFSFRSINFIPLISIFSEIGQIGKGYGGDSIFMIKLIVRNVGGNILLLMPLGFLAPILWSKFRVLKRVLILGLMVSGSIECLQLVELVMGIGIGRTVDIDDVICNVLGTIIGYYIYKLLNGIWRRVIKINNQVVSKTLK